MKVPDVSVPNLEPADRLASRALARETKGSGDMGFLN